MSYTRYLVTSALLMAIVPSAFGDTFSVNPKGSYLRPGGSDSVVGPTIINLNTLSFTINPGDTIHIQRVGFFVGTTTTTADVTTNMSGVFSATNTLLSSSNLNRVQDAIEAGVDFATPAAFFGGLSSDVSQDFAIDPSNLVAPTFSSIDIVVPAGANYLFVGAWDSHYMDNSDPNNDFAVSITAVPEPGSLLTLGLGCATLGFRNRRRTK